MDIAIAIDAESIPVTHRRNAAGSYSLDGDWVPGASTDTTIMAAVQPAPTQGVQVAELMDMPEGVRKEIRFFLWTRIDVVLDDVIIYDGSQYRVVYVWPRPMDGFRRVAIGLTKP